MASHRQSRASGSTAVDQSLAYTSDIAAGTLLIACIREGADPSADPVFTDTRGNTWIKAQRFERNSVFYAVSNGAGACTVSVDATSGVSSRLVLLEFNGTWTSPLSTIAAGGNGSTSPVVTNAATPGAASGVMIAFVGTPSDSNPFAISAGGYTLGPVAGNRAAPAYLCFSSAAAYQATYTTGAGISNGSSTQNIAFIESGGGGGAIAGGLVGSKLFHGLAGGLVR